ncbi:MAG: ImmA/IrrE family metallo-endopeptidase [Clostridia bacterium]|nr:ImmA/IrrE family metallo-endopeptidase [Clostridia bacterium]
MNEIKHIIKENGYDTIEYGSEQSLRLMDELNLREFAGGGAFAYSSNQIHLVFVDRDLSDREKVVALAHELGHVILGHMRNPGEKDINVTQEYEANEFAHFLINPSLTTRAEIFVRKKWIWIVSVIAVLLFGFIIWESADIGYYVTKSGTKYHKRNCEYVRRWGVRRIFNVTGYEPCTFCIGKDP